MTNEERLQAVEKKLDHSWIFGDSFIKRAFAIWGYSLAAIGMVYGAILVFAILGAILASF